MLVVCVHVMCACVRLNERTDARMRTEIKSLGKRWEKRIEGGHSRPILTIATDSSEPKRQRTITENKHRPNAVAEQTGAAAGANTKKVGSGRVNKTEDHQRHGNASKQTYLLKGRVIL